MYTKPNYIIEIDSNLSDEEIVKLKEFLEKNCISNKIYTSKQYIFESKFSNEIYEEHAKDRAYSMME